MNDISPIENILAKANKNCTIDSRKKNTIVANFSSWCTSNSEGYTFDYMGPIGPAQKSKLNKIINQVLMDKRFHYKYIMKEIRGPFKQEILQRIPRTLTYKKRMSEKELENFIFLLQISRAFLNSYKKDIHPAELTSISSYLDSLEDKNYYQQVREFNKLHEPWINSALKDLLRAQLLSEDRTKTYDEKNIQLLIEKEYLTLKREIENSFEGFIKFHRLPIQEKNQKLSLLQLMELAVLIKKKKLLSEKRKLEENMKTTIEADFVLKNEPEVIEKILEEFMEEESDFKHIKDIKKEDFEEYFKMMKPIRDSYFKKQRKLEELEWFWYYKRIAIEKSQELEITQNSIVVKGILHLQEDKNVEALQDCVEISRSLLQRYLDSLDQKKSRDNLTLKEIQKENIKSNLEPVIFSILSNLLNYNKDNCNELLPKLVACILDEGLKGLKKRYQEYFTHEDLKTLKEKLNDEAEFSFYEMLLGRRKTHDAISKTSSRKSGVYNVSEELTPDLEEILKPGFIKYGGLKEDETKFAMREFVSHGIQALVQNRKLLSLHNFQMLVYFIIKTKEIKELLQIENLKASAPDYDYIMVCCIKQSILGKIPELKNQIENIATELYSKGYKSLERTVDKSFLENILNVVFGNNEIREYISLAGKFDWEDYLYMFLYHQLLKYNLRYNPGQSAEVINHIIDTGRFEIPWDESSDLLGPVRNSISNSREMVIYFIERAIKKKMTEKTLKDKIELFIDNGFQRNTLSGLKTLLGENYDAFVTEIFSNDLLGVYLTNNMLQSKTQYFIKAMESNKEIQEENLNLKELAKEFFQDGSSCFEEKISDNKAAIICRELQEMYCFPRMYFKANIFQTNMEDAFLKLTALTKEFKLKNPLTLKDYISLEDLIRPEDKGNTISFEQIYVELLDKYCKTNHFKDAIYHFLFYILKRRQSLSTISSLIKTQSAAKGLEHINLKMILHNLYLNSDPYLRERLILDLSYSNPVPFIILGSTEENQLDYQFIPEVYDLFKAEQKKLVLSIGFGKCKGKSSLLNEVFGSSFELSSESPFFLHSYDIDTDKYFKTPSRGIYVIDAHGSAEIEIIKRFLQITPTIIIHVSENDIISAKGLINNFLGLIQIPTYVLLLVRDSKKKNQKESSYQIKRRMNMEIKVINLPDLSDDVDRQIHSNVIRDLIFQKSTFSAHKPKETMLAQLPNQSREFIENQEKSVSILVNKYIESMKDSSVKGSLLVRHDAYLKKNEHKQCMKNFNNFSLNKKEKRQNLKIQLRELEREFEDVIKGSHSYAYWKYFTNLVLSDTYLANMALLMRQLKLSREEIIAGEIEDKIKAMVKEERRGLTKEEENKIRYEVSEEYRPKSISVELFWRELEILSQLQESKEVNKLIERYRDLISFGHPFEIIDGDNYHFNGDFLKTVLKDVQNQKLLVISVIGPQNSGKSTLLNYIFGCSFNASDGRCTRGIYGSILKSNVPGYDYIFILDTEGLQSIEKSDPEYDRKVMLFCFALSEIVLINVKDEISDDMRRIFDATVNALERLKISHVHQPEVLLIMNQKADPNIDNQDTAFQKIKEVTSDHIQLADKHIMLPSAFTFHSIKVNLAKDVYRYSKTSPDFLARILDLSHRLNMTVTSQKYKEKSQTFTNIEGWLTLATKVFNGLNRYPGLTLYKDKTEYKQEEATFKYISSLFSGSLNEDFLKSIQEQISDRTLRPTEVVSQTFTLLHTELAPEVKEFCKQNVEYLPTRDRFYAFFESLLYSMSALWERDQTIIAYKSRIEEAVKNGDADVNAKVEAYLTRTKDTYKIEEVEKKIEEGYNLAYEPILELIPSRESNAVSALTKSDKGKRKVAKCLYQFFMIWTELPVFNKAFLNLTAEHLLNEYKSEFFHQIHNKVNQLSNESKYFVFPNLHEAAKFQDAPKFDLRNIVYFRYDLCFEKVRELIQDVSASDYTISYTKLMTIHKFISKEIIEDIDEEAQTYGLAISRDGISALYLYAIQLLSETYIAGEYSQLEAFYNKYKKLLEDTKTLKTSDLIKKEDNDGRASLVFVKKIKQRSVESWKVNEPKMLAELLNQFSTDLSRKKIQENLEADLETLDEAQLTEYVNNPGKMLESKFDVLWEAKSKNCCEEIYRMRDGHLALLQEFLNVLKDFLAKLGVCNTTGSVMDIFIANEGYLQENLESRRKAAGIMFKNYFLKKEYSFLQVDNVNLTLKDSLTILGQASLSEDLANIVKDWFEEAEEIRINNVIEYVKGFIEQFESMMSEIRGLDQQIYIKELIQSIQKEKLKSALGCDAKCPFCSRLCDVDHNGKPAGPENQHRCDLGHYLRAFKGHKYNENNEGVLKTCEEVNNEEYVLRNDQKRKFKDAKGEYSEWDFSSSVNTEENKMKVSNIWRKIGPGICSNISMTYTDINTAVGRSTPLHVFMLVDNSKSMSKYIEDIRKAMKDIIVHLKQKNIPEDLVSCTLFNHQSVELFKDQPLNENLADSAISTTGFTDYSVGLNAMVAFLNTHHTDATRKIHVILFSDGFAEEPPLNEIQTIKSQHLAKIKDFWAVKIGNSTYDHFMEDIAKNFKGEFRTQDDGFKVEEKLTETW